MHLNFWISTIFTFPPFETLIFTILAIWPFIDVQNSKVRQFLESSHSQLSPCATWVMETNLQNLRIFKKMKKISNFTNFSIWTFPHPYFFTKNVPKMFIRYIHGIRKTIWVDLMHLARILKYTRIIKSILFIE